MGLTSTSNGGSSPRGRRQVIAGSALAVIGMESLGYSMRNESMPPSGQSAEGSVTRSVLPPTTSRSAQGTRRELVSPGCRGSIWNMRSLVPSAAGPLPSRLVTLSAYRIPAAPGGDDDPSKGRMSCQKARDIARIRTTMAGTAIFIRPIIRRLAMFKRAPTTASP